MPLTPAQQPRPDELEQKSAGGSMRENRFSKYITTEQQQAIANAQMRAAAKSSAPMVDVSFLFGALIGALIIRALSSFVIKKIKFIHEEKKVFYGYGLTTILLFFLPAWGMTDGGRTPWAIGLATYIPILCLLFLWDLKKSGLIDKATTGGKINWNRGMMRLWGVIFIPIFLITEFGAYTTLMDAKYGRNDYATYEGAFSTALGGYGVLLFSLGFIYGAKWVIRGFKP